MTTAHPIPSQRLPREVLAAVDSMKPEAMDELLAPDVTFVTGSMPALRGREAVRADTAASSASIAPMSPTIDDVEVPAVVFFHEGNSGISKCQIYVDAAPVYA